MFFQETAAFLTSQDLQTFEVYAAQKRLPTRVSGQELLTATGGCKASRFVVAIDDFADKVPHMAMWATAIQDPLGWHMYRV